MDLATYIGLPFAEKGRDRAGVDCWGLIALIYREQLGIEVPSYVENYTSTKDGEEIAAIIRAESLDWREMPVEQACLGDVVILRIKGRPWHCGLVLDPPWFLHADRDCGVVRERWDALMWSRRRESVYRHPERIGRTTQ